MDEAKLRQILAKAERDLRESERKAVVDALATLPSRTGPIITLGSAGAALFTGNVLSDLFKEISAYPWWTKAIAVCLGSLVAICIVGAVLLSLANLLPPMPKRVEVSKSDGSFGNSAVRKIAEMNIPPDWEAAAADLYMARLAVSQREVEARDLEEAVLRIRRASGMLQIAFLVNLLLALAAVYFKSA